MIAYQVKSLCQEESASLQRAMEVFLYVTYLATVLNNQARQLEVGREDIFLLVPTVAVPLLRREFFFASPLSSSEGGEGALPRVFTAILVAV